MKKILCLAIILSVLCAVPHAVGASKKKASRAQTSTQGKSTTTAKSEEKKVAAAASDDAKPAANKAEEKKADAADAKKSDEKKGGAKDDKTDPANAAAGVIPDFGSAMPFDSIKFDTLEYDPDGMTVLTGRVHVESKDMNITCAMLRMDNKTKMAYATGNPVILDQGPAVKALCRKLTYNIDTKSAVLENVASIIQDKNGQKTQVGPADTIKIDYPPSQAGKDSKNAQPKISIFNRPDSKYNGSEIKVLGKEKESGAKPKSTRATKVSESSVGLINIPVPAKNPAAE
jgi:hypothetical protein